MNATRGVEWWKDGWQNIGKRSLSVVNNGSMRSEMSGVKGSMGKRGCSIRKEPEAYYLSSMF